MKLCALPLEIVFTSTKYMRRNFGLYYLESFAEWVYAVLNRQCLAETYDLYGSGMIGVELPKRMC